MDWKSGTQGNDEFLFRMVGNRREFKRSLSCYKRFMQKPLTPRQKLEYTKLEFASKRAESAMREAESASGKISPQYAVAERQRDEIVAKMQRMTRALDGTGSDHEPAASRVVTLVVRSRRIIQR